MIRLIEKEEIKELIPLAIEFISESKEDIPLNPEYFIEKWNQLIDNDIGNIFVLVKNGKIVGSLGFLVYEDILSGDLKSVESFWFVSKDYRGTGIKLLEAYEEFAKKIGIDRVMMIHLKKLMPEKLKSIYELRGYREIETQYEKVL